jgi:hypothetical protein
MIDHKIVLTITHQGQVTNQLTLVLVLVLLLLLLLLLALLPLLHPIMVKVKAQARINFHQLLLNTLYHSTPHLHPSHQGIGILPP